MEWGYNHITIQTPQVKLHATALEIAVEELPDKLVFSG